MRALYLPALLAIVCLAGCGEGSAPLTPDPPQAVGPAVVENAPDEGVLPTGVPDIRTIRAEALRLHQEHRATISSPGSDMNITVPDPARGIFTCQDGIDAAAPGATVTVLPTSVVEDVVLWVPDVVFQAAGTVDLYGSLLVFADRVTIKGFNVLRPATPTSTEGIYVAGVEGVRILGNTVAGWAARAVCADMSRDVLIEDNRFSGSFVGVHLFGALGSELAANTFEAFSVGVCSQQSEAVLCRGNVLDAVGHGITIDRGSGNTVQGNTLTTDHAAITVILSSENLVSHNLLTAGDCGVKLDRSHLNEVSDNNVLYGFRDGLALCNSDGNRILRNDTGGAGADGVHLIGTSGGNSVIGTTTMGHVGRGIVLDKGTHDNMVTASQAHANAGCDIVNFGTDNTFFDNDADCTFGF